MIAALPRTGSFLLSGWLSASGVAGFPQEYAIEADDDVWRVQYGFKSHPEYVLRLPDLCRTPNRVVGLKLMPWQLMALKEDLSRYFGVQSLSQHAALERWLGQVAYIRLLRHDEVRHAISLVRALKTNIWVRNATSKSLGPIEYDRNEIDHAVCWLRKQREVWDVFFERRTLKVITLAYEEFSQHQPERTVSQVLDWLGIKTPACRQIHVTLEKQRDALTDEWVALYRSGR